MPFVNGKFYMNPAHGRAVERARIAQTTSNHPDSRPLDPNAHWVTINHRHVLIGEEHDERNANSRKKKGYLPALSAKSKAAIEKAMGKGSASARMWEQVFLDAGARHGIDPNLLVGLAARQSSLNPDAVLGKAKGMFQITPDRQADLGLSDLDIFDPNVVVDSVAASLAKATKTLGGNTDAAIASWTVGLAGTKAALDAQGIHGVRNLLLDRAHPSYGRVGNYIDFVTSFGKPPM